MLNRCSVNFLLKSVILAVSGALVIIFALGAWSAYGRYGEANRVEALTGVSNSLFRAMSGLRLDRSFTDRVLKGDPVSPADRQQMLDARSTEMPPLKETLAALATLDYPNRQDYATTLPSVISHFEALQAESLAAMNQPKDSRRAMLASDFATSINQVLDTLDRLGADLGGATKLKDSFVDEMMTVKQLAWTARQSGGDASVILSNGLLTGKVAPDAAVTYARSVASLNTAWAALQDVGYGTALPPKYAAAVAKANSVYFGADYTNERDRLMKLVAAGEKPDISVPDWTKRSVGGSLTVLEVVLAALDAAGERAAAMHSDALRSLAAQLGFLAIALAVMAGSMWLIGRRVVRPLHAIRDAMVKLAGGDLTVDVGNTERKDEIGALFGTLVTFKANAVEKQRIEEEQKERHAEAVKRQEGIELSIKAFEKEVGGALHALDKASSDMRDVSQAIAGAASQGDRQVKVVVGAAAEASKHVDVVAGSAEELSAASNEISGQVTRAADIANRAVEEARQTDSTMQSLVGTTSRIGEVVDFINDIAGQTNLLALNATIEAARAGDAGKGFAVVASEVKSLASQTAKATQDIAEQIVAVQNVTKEAVEAIQRIGGTISEVSAVANSIAAAVREQAAATDEIKRSTEEAARRSGEVSSNMAHVADATEKTGGAAQGVQATASALGSEADRLREEVNGFLAKMRAA
ncbi:MAG TPA: HAMP domain-containing methyl-accepting chemotaxis protein [Stellaceae bacterium]|jgi:methyl-accepting chemotaxis protein|nr:HAMP domain-containing methyl-accepting chemotaxis protein [Stellaceae bacterium]